VAPLRRYEDGTWEWDSPPADTNAEFEKLVPEYLNAYDRLFSAAKKRSEFEFVCALVHIDKNSHQDPFETTKTTFDEIHKPRKHRSSIKKGWTWFHPPFRLLASATWARQ
jgi:hypothetical protein